MRGGKEWPPRFKFYQANINGQKGRWYFTVETVTLVATGHTGYITYAACREGAKRFVKQVGIAGAVLGVGSPARALPRGRADKPTPRVEPTPTTEACTRGKGEA